MCAIPLCGSCVTVYPKHAVVTTVFGRFLHAFTRPGLYFVNPCGREAQVVSLKATSVELPAVKVRRANDRVSYHPPLGTSVSTFDRSAPSFNR